MEELRECFEYEPDTGFLRRIKFTHWLQKEYPMASSSKGYWQMRWKGRVEKVHRLVWFWHHGIWPAWLDHINGDRKDNRIENLRECSASENAQNKKIRADNLTKFKGVSLRRGRYVARIQTEEKRIYLGSFETPEEAHAVYCEAANTHFKEFSKTE